MEKYKKKSGDELLAVMPVPKAFLKLALPAIAARLINILYNLVDKMFIGRIPGAKNIDRVKKTFRLLLISCVSGSFLIWRKIIILIPLIFILPHFVSNAAMGVYLAEPIADTIAVCTTGSMFYMYYRKLK